VNWDKNEDTRAVERG